MSAMEAKLNNLVEKSKKNAFSIAMIILALFFARNIFANQMKAIAVLKNKISVESKKNEELAYIGKLENKIGNLKNTINNKNMSKLINKMSSLAKDAGVSISSIKPQKEKSFAFYVAFPFDLIVTASNYHVLAKFINSLENSDVIFMIESLNLKLATQGKGNKPKDRVSVILGTLKINTVLISD